MPTYSVRPSFATQLAPQSSIANRLAALWQVAFLAVHFPLGMLVYQSSAIAAIHALMSLAVGLVAALAGRSQWVVWSCAYIVGSEIIWRMVDAPVFWEFGKYSISLIFLIALLKMRSAQYGVLPTFYFLLLLPAAALVVDLNNLNATRETISFNLSGPFSLMVSVWYFSAIRWQRVDLYRMWWVLIAPLITIVTLIILNISSVEAIYFGRSSSSLLSGGYGPNQVSNMLGLGVMTAFLLLTDSTTSRWLRPLLIMLLLLFATYSALTFSRGGLYAAGGSILVFSLFLLPNRQSLIRLLTLFIIVFLVANFLVLPRLDKFTGGALLDRFQDTSSTGRIAIMQADLIAFRDRPLTGVGLGGSKAYHAITFRRSAAHTEFTRLLAEHGLWGVGALLLLLLMAWRHFIRPTNLRDRALVVALVGWSFLFMMQASMRLGAPSLLFGLTALMVENRASSTGKRFLYASDK